MSKHTPGPWSSQDREKQVFVPLKSVDCERIGFSVGFVSGHREKEATANARLIAAAPDLLEVARAVDAHYSASLDHKPAYVALARAAIKAVEEKA